jgi:hypothetical protein
MSRSSLCLSRLSRLSLHLFRHCLPPLALALLLTLMPLSAHASDYHDCCDYSGSCPGSWQLAHDMESTVDGCTNMGTDGSLAGNGYCTKGNKIRPCNDDSCFTYVKHVSAMNGDVTISGKLFCPGTNAILQSYSATCYAGSHGNAMGEASTSAAYCANDAQHSGSGAVEVVCGDNGAVYYNLN